MLRQAFVASALLSGLLTVSCKSVDITESVFFRPRPCAAPTIDTPNAPEQLSIPVAEDTILQVVLAKQPDSRALIINFSGNETTHCPGTPAWESTARRRAREWAAEEKISIAYVHYRGYGGSGGSPSIEHGLRDALAVYDSLMADERFARQPVVVHGQSLGAAFAIALAGARPVQGLVLESPPTTARGVLANATPWFARPFVRYRIVDSLARQDNASAVAAIDKPLLVLVGDSDRITPPRMAAAILQASPAPGKSMVIVPGGHGDLARHDAFWTALSVFLAGLVSPA